LLEQFAIRKLHCTTLPLPQSLELAATIEATGADARFLPGGCGANMAAWLAKLGSQVTVVAPFGQDANGALARRDLEQRGVTVAGFDYDGPHSLIYTLITEDRERTFADYCHGVRYDLLDSARALRSESMVAIDGYLLLRLGAADGVRAYLGEERPLGQRILFAPGDVSVLADAAEAASFVLDRCTHLVMNRNEAGALFPGGSDDEIVAALRARGIAGAVTQGEEGALLFDGEQALHVPSAGLDRAIVNTNGAGDAFTSGYMHGLDRGLPLAETARLASACAAEILVSEAARPALLSEVFTTAPAG
jgi:sugar/nucleoside kinase (ribokinase family)